MLNKITENDLEMNWGYIVYTYLHRKAILYCIERDIKNPELKEKMLERAKFHDLDKVYLYTFLPKKEASRIHRLTSVHHTCNELPKTYEDMVEAYLDYESAGFTKEDKPLNAYDTILTYDTDKETKERLLAITKEMGTNYSYRNPKDEESKNDWYKYITPFIIKNIINKINYCLFLFNTR